MSKQAKIKRMQTAPSDKARGRTAKTIIAQLKPTKGDFPVSERTQASRPVSAGTGRKRGDRRDTSPTYTGNRKHSARGNTPRVDVKTRKR